MNKPEIIIPPQPKINVRTEYKQINKNNITTEHDNDTNCFINHLCINCINEKVFFDEEPCLSCIGNSKINKVCKWKLKT